MGRSHLNYTMAACALGRHQVAEETWVINAMGGIIAHDRVFLMDDVEALPVLKERFDYWLKDHPGPVYTSNPAPYACMEAYPLEDVMNAVGCDYFNTTLAYAMGLAIAMEIKSIKLFGCDFNYPDAQLVEAGRGCMEFLIGIAIERGIKVVIANSSTLMDSNKPNRLYGYANPPKIAIVDNRYIINESKCL